MKSPVWLAILVCGLASLFYLYEFTLQVSPAIITHELMRDFGVKAAGLGIISAFYYYSYSAMQFPAGILYDRFGPRLVMTMAIIMCALGAIFFSMATSASLASLGRFLMGIGSAFSFIGALTLISRWFPPKHFAWIAGITQTMSCVGAMIAEAPLAAFVGRFGWRPSIMTIGIIGLVLALLVWLFVRNYPSKQKSSINNTDNGLHGGKEVLSSTQTWFIAIYSFASWSPVLVFAGLWGVNYLASLYHISTIKAALPMMMVWLGIAVTCPLIGWWSDFMGRRNILLILVQAVGLIAIIFILYVPVPFSAMYLLLFMMGVAASGQSLAFGVVKDINKPRFIGTAIGFNNMAVVVGGAILQPLAGLFLQHHWTGTMSEGVPTYTAAAYQGSMGFLPILYVIGIILAFKFIRETFCKDLYRNNGN
jgi:sugar phosphate permease